MSRSVFPLGVLAVLLVVASGCAFLKRPPVLPPTVGPVILPAATSDHEVYAKKQGLILKQYDLNRDDRSDVFKFYRQIDDRQHPGNKLEMLVRSEWDINHDGKVDLVRDYDENGKVLEEQVDLDFDGKFDQITFYQDGQIVRRAADLNFDGKAEVVRYYQDGVLQRVEWDRDGDNRVDVWEYYENGELDRIGTDTDGDGEVDHWERKGDSAPSGGGTVRPQP